MSLLNVIRKITKSTNAAIQNFFHIVRLIHSIRQRRSDLRRYWSRLAL